LQKSETVQNLIFRLLRAYIEKAELLHDEAARLSQKTRGFPTPFSSGFGFSSSIII